MNHAIAYWSLVNKRAGLGGSCDKLVAAETYNLFTLMSSLSCSLKFLLLTLHSLQQVFICEQKLYNKAQLKQHRNTGDSEVDGSESERGGFQGHPFCEFCRTPFYGDNELYTHMSADYFTCHICKRQNPGQFEYYQNYEHLETSCLF
nr:zinc finger protein 598 [Tanacetum cinerariifolium]